MTARSFSDATCPYHLCHPDVFVVKAAQDGHRYDAPGRLNGSPEGSALPEGYVRADTIAVVGVGLKHAAEVRFAKYYDVVEALPADRADEPLYMAVLPWRA